MVYLTETSMLQSIIKAGLTEAKVRNLEAEAEGEAMEEHRQTVRLLPMTC